MGLDTGMKESFNMSKSLNVIHYENRIKNKNSMIISIDAEKAFEKIQYSFMTKTLNKLGIEGMHLNIIKTVYEKPTANIICNYEKLKAFSLRLRTSQGYLISLFLYNIILEGLVIALR